MESYAGAGGASLEEIFNGLKCSWRKGRALRDPSDKVVPPLLVRLQTGHPQPS